MKDQTLDILRRHLDGDFQVFPMASNQTTISDIREVETMLQIKFPEEFVCHLLAENAEVLAERGLYIEVKEDVWPRAKQYDVGPFWSFLYGIYTFTASKTSEDWMRLDIAGKNFMEDTGIRAVPILQVIGDADMYCVREDGKIVQYNHELNSIEECVFNFWELYENEIKNLKQRKEWMKQKIDDPQI